MRAPFDQPLMVILLAAGALAMAVPAGHAMVAGDFGLARGFFYSGMLIGLLAVLLAVALSGFRPANVARSHLLQLAGGFVLVPLALALPLVQVLPGLTLLRGWFEMVSCLTSTGATLLDPLTTPASVHLWRGLVGWLGGLFTLVAALSILAPMNLGGFEVLSGLGAGRGMGGAIVGPKRASPVPQIARIADPSQRMKRHAAQIAPIYAGLTLVLWLLLVLAGDAALPGLIRAMSTLSTSGIVPGDAPASGRAGEVAVALFMVLALSRHAFPGASRRISGPGLRHDPEFRLGLGIVVGAAVGLLAVQIAGAGEVSGAFTALWGNLFTALSCLTTTGFISADWTAAARWSGQPQPGMVLMVLALIGGGVATTTGGLRLIRLYALSSHARHELERLVHPHSVGSTGKVARVIRAEGAHVAWVFAMLFLISVAVVLAALTLSGIGFEPGLVLALSALTTTGPLAGFGGSVPVSWVQSDAATAILAAAMVLGRLETLALIALLAPDSWRR